MADEWSHAVPRRGAAPASEDQLPVPPAHSGRRALPEPEEEQPPNRAGRRFAPAEEDPVPRPTSRPTPVTDPPSAPSGSHPHRRWLLILAAGLLVITVGVASWFLVIRHRAVPSPILTTDETTDTLGEPTSPTPSPDPENTEGAPEAIGELQVNDTSLTAPPGWRLYGDESIENDRRVIRLSHAETDVRLQVATIAEVQGDVAEACETLSTAQQESFTDVTSTPTLGIGIDPAQGSGITCGFHGTRAGDGVAVTVTFTVVLRISDGHLLSLRSMIPDSLEHSPESERARGDLAAMNCAAGRNFQVTLPLC
ncbi:MAG: hypothetical protein Q4D89_11165 [Arachnia propionica]|uniref:hypothetical protein n=1 Tax=Arachnia propionica TaxID=1750 RepID=UPI00270A07A1|nr:hypothetical protein [Arachnia propionica]